MASEAKHTPGPWRFDHDWNRLPTVFGANGKKVCVIERDVRGEPSDEQKTDAELIASLPTLLAERDAAPVAVEEAKKETNSLIETLSKPGIRSSHVSAQDILAKVRKVAAALSSIPTAQVKS